MDVKRLLKLILIVIMIVILSELGIPYDLIRFIVFHLA